MLLLWQIISGNLVKQTGTDGKPMHQCWCDHLFSDINHFHLLVRRPTPWKGMTLLRLNSISAALPTQPNFSPIPPVQSWAEGFCWWVGMHGLQSPWSLTDLWVEGGWRCAWAADKLHKEGPVLKSEEEEAAAAAANARERRNECGPVVNHQGKERVWKKKIKIKTRREGEKQGHMRGKKEKKKGERQRKRERDPPRRPYPNAKHKQESTPSWAEYPTCVGASTKIEGVSKLPRVSSEPSLDACTLSHSSERPSNLCQGRGKGHRATRRRGRDVRGCFLASHLAEGTPALRER